MDTLRFVLFWVGVALLVVAALAAHGTNVHVSWNVSLCMGLVAVALAFSPNRPVK